MKLKLSRQAPKNDEFVSRPIQLEGEWKTLKFRNVIVYDNKLSGLIVFEYILKPADSLTWNASKPWRCEPKRP